MFTVKPRAPWFNGSILSARRDLRQYERRWKTSRLEIQRQMYLTKRTQYNRTLDNARAAYYRSKIQNVPNQRQLFSVIDDLVGERKSTASLLPRHNDAGVLANQFADFFSGKIRKIREQLSDSNQLDTHGTTPSHSFSQFRPVTELDISEIILSMKTKSCAIDPIRTDTLKSCLSDTGILPFIVSLVNSSLYSGSVPDRFKRAIVHPLLKKSGLDFHNFSNFRPVYNLPFISKVLEKAVMYQLDDYLQEFGLYAKFQSAYRKFHSTETALLRVYNDILLSLDKRKEVVLVLLDLSAAFETIDHSVLISRMSNRFGVTGVVLDWLKSYLNDRHQFVSVDNVLSHPSSLLYGVPQGSILGPLLFTLYTSPIENIIQSHGLDCMFYADDTQVYLTCSRAQNSVDSIEKCIQDVSRWMSANKLVLNERKTEIVHFHSKFKDVNELVSLNIGSATVNCCDSVRNLGIYFDSVLSMDTHISKVSQSVSFSLYRISRIRKFLSQSCTERLIHAFVTSRLDYCNSILYGLSDSLIRRLQLLQNSAARLVARSRINKHITPVLYDLHWLPISQRIKFKILVITFKILHGSAPLYVSEILTKWTPSRCTRQAVNEIRFKEPSYNTEFYGARAFAVAAPRLWNKLPISIRMKPTMESFKSSLKTHLFQQYFI